MDKTETGSTYQVLQQLFELVPSDKPIACRDVSVLKFALHADSIQVYVSLHSRCTVTQRPDSTMALLRTRCISSLVGTQDGWLIVEVRMVGSKHPASEGRPGTHKVYDVNVQVSTLSTQQDSRLGKQMSSRINGCAGF